MEPLQFSLSLWKRGPHWRAAGLFALAAGLLAQQAIGPDEMRGRSSPYTPPAETNTIRAQVNLVEVPVVVLDGGRAVAGLQRGDFQVFDSGKPREIVSFSAETVNRPVEPAASGPPADKPAPAAPVEHPQRYVALLFDDLNTDFSELQQAKAAAERFVKEGLTTGDRVAVATTAGQKTLSFSADGAELTRQIEAVTAHRRFTDDSSSVVSCPHMNPYEAYLISNCLDPDLVGLKETEYEACRSGAGGSAAPGGTRRGRGQSVCNAPVVSVARRFWEQARSNSDSSLRVIRAVVDALGKLSGRRMILLTSSGFISGELEGDMNELTHRALYAGVVINSLEARGLFAFAPGVDSTQTPQLTTRGRQAIQTTIMEQRLQERGYDAPDDVLASLAYGTGGNFFHNNNDLAAGYRQLGSVPDIVYMLGFSISDVAQDGRYHALKVRLTGGHRGSVEARPGYLAPLAAPPVSAAPAPVRAIDHEFLAGNTVDDVPVTIVATPRKASGAAAPLPGGAPALTLVAHVDLSRLNVEVRDGRRTQSLTFVAGLLDANGVFVGGKQGNLDLALKEATYGRMAPQGFNMTLTLDAPPGKYILRGVVLEGLTGKMTAMNQAVEIQ